MRPSAGVELLGLFIAVLSCLAAAAAFTPIPALHARRLPIAMQQAGDEEARLAAATEVVQSFSPSVSVPFLARTQHSRVPPDPQPSHHHPLILGPTYPHPQPFSPAWWAKNPHVQTIYGSKSLQESIKKVTAPPKDPQIWRTIYDRRERWETPDADWFHVDFMFHPNGSSLGGAEGPRPMAVVLHGLESSSTALLPRSMAQAFVRQGFDVAALNFRGCCGGGDNDRPYAYHLGFTDDLKYALRRLAEDKPTRRLYLSGFSLGGNVILKWCGSSGGLLVVGRLWLREIGGLCRPHSSSNIPPFSSAFEPRQPRRARRGSTSSQGKPHRCDAKS